MKRRRKKIEHERKKGKRYLKIGVDRARRKVMVRFTNRAKNCTGVKKLGREEKYTSNMQNAKLMKEGRKNKREV